MFRLKPGIKSNPAKRWNLPERVFFACGACRCEEVLVAHHWAKGRRWWPGWDGTLVPLPQDVLISEAKSKTYDGLWLREPGQFLHDAMPRAQAFLARFGPPPSGDGQAGGALLDETGLRRQIGSGAVADA